MFKNAIINVQNTYKALLIFIAISAGYVALRTGVETLVIGEIDLSNPDTITKIYLLSATVLTALVWALAQSLAYPIMGEYIERPTWKAHRAPGAFVRFFSFWFTLNLINLSCFLLIAILPTEDSTRESLQIMWIICQTAITPFGATVMFFGETTKNAMIQAANTMITQLPSYALICFISFFVIITLQINTQNIPDYLRPLLEVPSSYLDCFIFAYSWEICRRHREEEEENMDDLEF